MCLAASALLAQAPQGLPAVALDWHHVGNSLIDRSLADLTTGAVDRVWYSPDGGTLYVTTALGRSYETSDFETWRGSLATAPAAADLVLADSRPPEPGVRLRGQAAAVYAFGAFVYRSPDGGKNWTNLTAFQTTSILGNGMRDLAVSPRDPNDVSVASSAGVFRSLDGGKSWSGLNEGLPNLPGLRLRGLPSGDRGVQLELPGASVVEWQPGEKRAWRPVDNALANAEFQTRRGLNYTALQIEGNTVYAGTQDGNIMVASGGVTQTFAVNGGGAVERFWVDSRDPRIALAVLGARPQTSVIPATHVLFTRDAGGIWDDVTGNLPDAAVHGATASRSGNAIYVATDRGVFFSKTDLNVRAGAAAWQKLAGLPDSAAEDVRLDAADIQLWVAIEGYGVFSSIAPHRLGDPRVVSAADLVARAAAPGALMSIEGARVTQVRAGDLPVPVLAATDTETQIQIPFEARGDTVSLAIDPVSGGRLIAPLRLETSSPGIWVQRDGSPMLLDANTGTLLDTANPAHSRARIQILATGLGRVQPEWPTGVEAPLENPPAVAAKVSAWLDRAPVDVTRAVLAPGFTGLYLVEIEVPKIVNYGPAELYLEVDGRASNRVRVYIEP